MKKSMLMFLLVVCKLSFSQSGSTSSFDPIFPAKRSWSSGFITAYTGNPPPVAIFDLTYGVSNKTSIAIVAGTTGELALMGLRANFQLYQQKNFRALFRFNGIYYPERNGKFLFDNSIKHVMPWMFTMGIADAEWKTKKGTRWTLGIGYLETHCIDGMMKFFNLSTDDDEDTDLPLEVYNIIHGGVSIPLSQRLFLRPEIIVVMKGLSTIPVTADAKASPFNPYVNLVYYWGNNARK